MSVQPIALRPDQHEPALNVIGTQVTVLASNAATQSYGITLQQGEEGTGPLPHCHDWNEAFRRLAQAALDLLGKAYRAQMLHRIVAGQWGPSDTGDNVPLN